ncbi:hypothetical protein GEMRC1_003070 [Eukaryota sp. GEM-RC1]
MPVVIFFFLVFFVATFCLDINSFEQFDQKLRPSLDVHPISHLLTTHSALWSYLPSRCVPFICLNQHCLNDITSSPFFNTLCLLLHADLFQDNLLSLNESEPTAVILLPHLPTTFSPLPTSFPPDTHQWNPLGLNLINTSLSFPLLSLSSSSYQSLRSRFPSNSSDLTSFPRPTFSLTYRTSASPSSTSSQCLSSRSCLPVGGHSVYGFVGHDISTTTNVILVTANTDEFEFFKSQAPSARFTASSLSSTIGSLRALSTISNVLDGLGITIGFLFSSSDNYGDLGTSMFVNDLTNFHCSVYSEDGTRCESPQRPSLLFKHLNISKVSAVFGVSGGGGKNVYLHYNTTSDKVSKILNNVEFLNQKGFDKLPPSPVQFLSNFQNSNFSADFFSLSDFYQEYSSKYKASPFDNQAVDKENLCKISKSLVKSMGIYLNFPLDLLDELTSTVDCSFIANVHKCLRGNFKPKSCTLLKSLQIEDISDKVSGDLLNVSNFEAFGFRFDQRSFLELFLFHLSKKWIVSNNQIAFHPAYPGFLTFDENGWSENGSQDDFWTISFLEHQRFFYYETDNYIATLLSFCIFGFGLVLALILKSSFDTALKSLNS